MLPPVFTITPEMLRLIAELDEFKGQWRMIRSLTPEKLNSLRKIATIESVGSSTRIEGSKLTDREVEDLLGRLHVTEFKTRDEQEVAGYAYVTLRKNREPGLPRRKLPKTGGCGGRRGDSRSVGCESWMSLCVRR